MVELHLTKVELNLVQQCRIAITLKRGMIGNCQFSYMLILTGDHVVETKNALSLEKGTANFDEKLVIPATLYKEKKGLYIKKEVLNNHRKGNNFLGNHLDKCHYTKSYTFGWCHQN